MEEGARFTFGSGVDAAPAAPDPVAADPVANGSMLASALDYEKARIEVTKLALEVEVPGHRYGPSDTMATRTVPIRTRFRIGPHVGGDLAEVAPGRERRAGGGGRARGR
jgi:hypothetical protein